MYEYHNNLLSIPAKLLYEEWEVMSYDTYQKWVRRGKLIRTKEGRGSGNEAFVSYHDLSMNLQKMAIANLGDPEKVAMRNGLEQYIVPDMKAVRFFAAHCKANGRPLSIDKQREKATNCMILNAIKTVLNSPKARAKMWGRKKTKIWQNISEAVNAVNTNKWAYSLPANYQSLRRKYNQYLLDGAQVFIHKGEGNANAQVIKGSVADWLLATYCLPIKYSVTELWNMYCEERELHGWGTLTEQAIRRWLNEPEQERVWTLARHGRESYNKKYKHTLTRKKSAWHPNIYWAIDGTKLDWIHFWDESSNKMGSKLKIDVMFDIYSEKILGYSLSFSETYTDHFKAAKMSINTANSRPYLITYDNQSGHKSARMQEFYSRVVAVDGGAHYANKAYEHNSPVEQLFNRFQQQVINKFWFSDGQGIKVRRDDHKMNEDFIVENKTLLKTYSELEAAWEYAVKLWNERQHPKFKESRNEVYQHPQLRQEKLELWDIVDQMWVEQRKKPITYKAHGMDLWVGDEKYQYEVYNRDGSIDLDFRRKNVGRKFVVRYDPTGLDTYIQLLIEDENKELVHIATAEPKREHEVVPALMLEGSKAIWQDDFDVRKEEYERDAQAYKDLIKRTGITRERMMEDQELEIKLQRKLTKQERSRVESEENILAQL